VSCGFSHILKEDGKHGNVPSYFLELNDIPGDTFAEQIRYRRMWHTLVDEVANVLPDFSPLTGHKHRNAPALALERRPLFTEPLTDVNVCDGDTVVLEPEITSASPFTVTWRGPAVQSGKAEIKTDGKRTRLIIGRVVRLDSGPYSVVAKNAYGCSSSLAVVKVIARPDPPKSVVCERVGRNALLLSWSSEPRSGLLFCVEYKSEGKGLVEKLQLLADTGQKYGKFCRNVLVSENAPHFSSCFNLGEICARGRSSVVYDAKHLKTQRSLIVKVLVEGRAKEDIEREVAILSMLHHTNMPRFKGVFLLDGQYCIAMKKMAGVPISVFVDEFVHSVEGGQLEKLMQHLSTDILSALSYLHTRSIAHLDVKPANLLVSDHVSLVDFGSARFLDADDVDWGDGDKSYSAPERIAMKRPSAKSDIWSFGAVLFEVCFGVAPHRMLTTLTVNAERRSQALLSFLNEENVTGDSIQVLALEAARRPSAAECLQHQWPARENYEYLMKDGNLDQGVLASRANKCLPLAQYIISQYEEKSTNKCLFTTTVKAVFFFKTERKLEK
ncbi:kinase domain protein, partial [Necator americanus]